MGILPRSRLIFKPGNQPHNQIAATFREQLARAFLPRPEPYPLDVAERIALTIDRHAILQDAIRRVVEVLA